MKTRVHFFAFIIIASLLLQACGGDSQSVIQTAVAQTQQISQLQTAAAKGGGEAVEQPEAESEGQEGQEEASPTDTPTPSDTATITNTPTPSIPMVSVSSETNCRTGPAASYGYVTVALTGEQYEVVGTWAEGDDYLVVRIGSRTCWLWTRYANNTDFSAYNLTSYTTPPTPTPTFTATPAFDWAATWNMSISANPPVSATFSVTGNSVSATWNNGATDVTLNGTISAGRQELSGTWSTTVPTNGTFQFRIKSGNLNQFTGSYVYLGTTFPWCGATSGASQPSPCQWP